MLHHRRISDDLAPDNDLLQDDPAVRRELIALHDVLNSLGDKPESVEPDAVHAGEDTVLLDEVSRWRITISAGRHLRSLAAFRSQLLDWSETLDVRVTHVTAEAASLRLTTAHHVPDDAVRRITQQSRELVGIDGQFHVSQLVAVTG